jgi:hypothetical protein
MYINPDFERSVSEWQQLWRQASGDVLHMCWFKTTMVCDSSHDCFSASWQQIAVAAPPSAADATRAPAQELHAPAAAEGSGDAP